MHTTRAVGGGAARVWATAAVVSGRMGVGGRWRLADRTGLRGANFSHLAPLIWTRVCVVFSVEIGTGGRFGSRPSLQTNGYDAS